MKRSDNHKVQTDLKEPDLPLVIHHEVKSKQLKAVGQREEGQLATHSIQTFACMSNTVLFPVPRFGRLLLLIRIPKNLGGDNDIGMFTCNGKQSPCAV